MSLYTHGSSGFYVRIIFQKAETYIRTSQKIYACEYASVKDTRVLLKGNNIGVDAEVTCSVIVLTCYERPTLCNCKFTLEFSAKQLRANESKTIVYRQIMQRKVHVLICFITRRLKYSAYGVQFKLYSIIYRYGNSTNKGSEC